MISFEGGHFEEKRIVFLPQLFPELILHSIFKNCSKNCKVFFNPKCTASTRASMPHSILIPTASALKEAKQLLPMLKLRRVGRGSRAASGGMLRGERGMVGFGVFQLRKNILYYYSKGMNFAYFPLREFTEALGVTAKVKSRLQPFVEEVENYNMEWLFQMLMQLYSYTVSPDCELVFKFNALVALKILLDTCELPLIMMVEVYFLPHVRRIATYQLQASEKHRGLDYFLVQGYANTPDAKKLGYNYVRLASEIVTMMAVVKPYRLYRDEELAEASEFVNVLEIMRAQQWREYDIFAFYLVEETQMRENFLRKLKGFARCAERYYDFLDTYLDKFIRKEYSPKVLDPRKILETAEVFACTHVLEELRELYEENRASIKANVLRLFTDFVRWGYIKAAYLIECEGIFDELLRQARTVKGGKGAFRSIGGSEEDRRNLYYQVVRSLQIWAVCIPKSPMNLVEESKCSLVYKQFLKQQVEVPFSGNIKKIRNQCEGNLQKNYLINLLIMKELKKNDFDASKMRRTSSNLEELINLDKNMSSSMAALIMQAKFINDLKPDLNSTSSLSTSNHLTNPRLLPLPPKTSTSNLESTTEPAKKENRQPRSKQAFNKHKTVILSNLLSNNAQTSTVRIADEFRCLPECTNDDENYTEDCDQKFQIKQLRSINNKNGFNCLRASKKMADNFQLDTVKQGKDVNESEMVEFFEETVRSCSNSLNSSSFVVQVIKPSPFKEDSKPNSKNPPNITTPIKGRKQKASMIQCQQRLGFPTRRNELTVAPDLKRGEGRPQESYRWSWNEFMPDEEDREGGSTHGQHYLSIDQAKFLPFLKQISKMEGRKALMRNKDVLLKTNKIEIGFIFELRTHQTALLTIFITPEQSVSKLEWDVACPSTVTCSERGQRVTEIARHKQRKQMFYFWVKPPYSLPTLTLKYEMEGRQYQHNLVLPISFNKFVKYTPRPPQLTSPVSFRTSIEKFNSKDFPTSQIISLFQEFSVKKGETSVQMVGGAEYEGTAFGLTFLLREGSHIQIRCMLEEREMRASEVVQFLMAVLLSTLKK